MHRIVERALWPLRILLILLLVALTGLIWRGGDLSARTLELERRDRAFAALSLAARDAALAGPGGAAVAEEGGLGAALAAAADRAATEEERAALSALSEAAPARVIAGADALSARSRSELRVLVEQRAAMRAWVVPLFLATLALMAVLALVSFRRGMGEARDAEAARLLPRIESQRDRADLLAREMRHRVKNLFAVIASIVTASARGEGDPEQIAARTRGRIEALARAHDHSSDGGALGAFSARQAMESVIAPYAPAPARLAVGGDAGDVPASAATPLGLVANELATNAVKYGAWSGPEGIVRVTVAERADLTEIVWRETGGPAWDGPAEGASGFGERMIETSVSQLGGRIERRMRPGGLEVVLSIPAPPPEAGARP